MHIISRKKLRKFCQKYADSCDALNNWYKAANKSTWNNLTEVQAVYPEAEAVGNFTVFNIKGNKYRLIVDLVYSDQIIYLKYIFTQAEYDKDKWKNDPYF
ncbi:MAG: type II toxin-antitoxin system HigB family toxin [Nostoc sp.]|uniref:type II toxin-antitoxin system HigB family toxin n=1 Tax=Nostoc sp. TaxID=1180 RepID=UPI002FF56A22